MSKHFKLVTDYYNLSKYLTDSRLHYDNTPIQYSSIFNGCKKYNFHMKIIFSRVAEWRSG